MVLCEQSLTRIIYLYLLLWELPIVWAYFGLTSRDPLRTLSLDLKDNTVEQNGQNKMSSSELCAMMNLEKRQKRMCRRGRGIAHTLVEGTRIAALECTFQFQYDRWNCSIEDKYRQNILIKANTPN